jgi:hypothetical protein
MATTRYRSRGGLVPGTPLLEENKNSTGCTAHDWQFLQNIPTGPLVGDFEEYRDCVVDRFKHRIKIGEIIPTNEMQSSKLVVTVEAEGNGITYRLNAPVCTSPTLMAEGRCDSGLWLLKYMNAANISFSPLQPKPVISQTDINDLVKEATTKVLGDRGNADNNLFESIAEYRQAIDLLTNPTKSFFTVMNDPRRSFLGKAARSAADAWAVYRWGIRPMVNDVNGILSGLKKQVGRRRVTTRSSESIRRVEAGSLSGSYGIANVIINYTTTDEVTVRARTLDEVDFSVANNIGFSVKGLTSLPWELVPYSFVADWFVNVGDYIRALTPVPGLKLLDDSLTIERVVKTIYSAGPTSLLNNDYSITRPVSGSISSTLKTKTRSRLGAPKLVVRSDFRFDKALRIADGLALAAQRLDSAVMGYRR